ncbi:hemolymph lipopolysaccharide-binding protein-like isoform X2 [Periplaneta americana]|uniref:hemolymph lipopolysaccharide-binding protein-like isoform X2 n=1 Tax=Periplaneta americana TaxID=6978 RepID=UPI0037E8F07A
MKLTLMLVCAVLWIASSHSSCLSPNIKFSLTSRKNQTGHWIAQLQRGDGTSSGTSAPLSVEIEHNTIACEGSTAIQVIATLVAPPPKAHPGYELFPGVGYYKLHTKSAVWEEAIRICEQEGAHLGIINSDEESQVMGNLLARHPKLVDVVHQGVAFLGFHDMYVEGQYVTIFGEPLNSTGYVKWNSNQPDNAGGNPGEDCGSVLTNGKLNDLPCRAKEAFICEQEIW